MHKTFRSFCKAAKPCYIYVFVLVFTCRMQFFISQRNGRSRREIWPNARLAISAIGTYFVIHKPKISTQRICVSQTHKNLPAKLCSSTSLRLFVSILRSSKHFLSLWLQNWSLEPSSVFLHVSWVKYIEQTTTGWKAHGKPCRMRKIPGFSLWTAALPVWDDYGLVHNIFIETKETLEVISAISSILFGTSTKVYTIFDLHKRARV